MPEDKMVRELEKRSRVIRTVTVLVVLVLIGQLFNIQLIQGQEYRQLSENNRIRNIDIQAPRGSIFDSKGRVLADSRPAYTVSVMYMGEREMAEVIARLAPVLEMEPSELEGIIKKGQAQRGFYQPVRVKTDISPEVHTVLEEMRSELPGVIIDVEPVRYYPMGKTAAHILGYVGRREVPPGDLIGKFGLEAVYDAADNPYWRFDTAAAPEKVLRGTDGGQLIEVDAKGRRVRVLGEEKPVRGDSLNLTIDAGLQAAAERALEETIMAVREGKHPYWGYDTKAYPNADRGTVVVVEVNTGRILAMANYPSFDPNNFAVGRPTEEDLASQYNLAIQSAVPTGSTFKMVTVAAALGEGKATPQERFQTYGGRYPRLNQPKCWAYSIGGHGVIGLEEALTVSCDVVMYELGYRLGIDKLAEYAGYFGLGQKTGLKDLPGEVAGGAASREKKRRLFSSDRFSESDRQWMPGETLSAAIGQSYNEFTALQMALYTATIANGGTRYRPYLVDSIIDNNGKSVMKFSPEVVDDISDRVSPEVLALLQRGMLGVVKPGGTAASTFRGFTEETKAILGYPVEVAGKSGTVEFSNRDDDAWFVAYGPYDKPEIAIAAMVHQGGGGSSTAGSIVRKVFEYYFGLRPKERPGSAPGRRVPDLP